MIVYAKVALRYVGEFCDAGVIRELAEGESARYKADGSDLKDFLFPVELRDYVQNLDTGRTTELTERIDDKEESWNSKRMVISEKLASSGLCSRL